MESKLVALSNFFISPFFLFTSVLIFFINVHGVSLTAACNCIQTLVNMHVSYFFFVKVIGPKKNKKTGRCKLTISPRR